MIRRELPGTETLGDPDIWTSIELIQQRRSGLAGHFFGIEEATSTPGAYKLNLTHFGGVLVEVSNFKKQEYANIDRSATIAMHCQVTTYIPPVEMIYYQDQPSDHSEFVEFQLENGGKDIWKKIAVYLASERDFRWDGTAAEYQVFHRFRNGLDLFPKPRVIDMACMAVAYYRVLVGTELKLQTQIWRWRWYRSEHAQRVADEVYKPLPHEKGESLQDKTFAPQNLQEHLDDPRLARVINALPHIFAADIDEEREGPEYRDFVEHGWPELRETT